MTDPYTIGLTGNIACGKSTVGAMLVELGAEYLDTDRVVHELLGSDTPEALRIVEHFGAEVHQPGGGIKRAALGAIVFSDAAALHALERMLYPRVEEIVHERMRTAQAPILVIDGVKIFESGLASELDELWVVVCSPESQRDRLATHRGMAEHDIAARIASQPPLEAKLAQARVVIDNSGDVSNTKQQVQAAYRRILEEMNGPSHA